MPSSTSSTTSNEPTFFIYQDATGRWRSAFEEPASRFRSFYAGELADEFNSEEEPFMPTLAEAADAARVPRLRLRFTLQQARVLGAVLEYLEYDLAERLSPARAHPKETAIQFWFPLVSAKRKNKPNRDQEIFDRLVNFRSHLRMLRSFYPLDQLAQNKKLKGITAADFRLLITLLFAITHKNEVLYYLRRYENVNAAFMRDNAAEIDGIRRKLETITVDRLVRRWGPIPLPQVYRYQVLPEGGTTLAGGLEQLRAVG